MVARQEVGCETHTLTPVRLSMVLDFKVMHTCDTIIATTRSNMPKITNQSKHATKPTVIKVFDTKTCTIYQILSDEKKYGLMEVPEEVEAYYASKDGKTFYFYMLVMDTATQEDSV